MQIPVTRGPVTHNPLEFNVYTQNSTWQTNAPSSSLTTMPRRWYIGCPLLCVWTLAAMVNSPSCDTAQSSMVRTGAKRGHTSHDPSPSPNEHKMFGPWPSFFWAKERLLKQRTNGFHLITARMYFEKDTPVGWPDAVAQQLSLHTDVLPGLGDLRAHDEPSDGAALKWRSAPELSTLDTADLGEVPAQRARQSRDSSSWEPRPARMRRIECWLYVSSWQSNQNKSFFQPISVHTQIILECSGASFVSRMCGHPASARTSFAPLREAAQDAWIGNMNTIGRILSEHGWALCHCVRSHRRTPASWQVGLSRLPLWAQYLGFKFYFAPVFTLHQLLSWNTCLELPLLFTQHQLVVSTVHQRLLSRMSLQHRRFMMLLRLSWSTLLQHQQVAQLQRVSCILRCTEHSWRSTCPTDTWRSKPRPWRVHQAQEKCWDHGVAAPADTRVKSGPGELVKPLRYQCRTRLLIACTFESG